MTPEVQDLAFGAAKGLILSSAFLLALFVGFCVLLNLPKLRTTGRKGLVVRSLEETVGGVQQYLPPDAPRGRVDQLRGRELPEPEGRKSG